MDSFRTTRMSNVDRVRETRFSSHCSESSHCIAKPGWQLLKVAVGGPSRDSLVTVRARSRSYVDTRPRNQRRDQQDQGARREHRGQRGHGEPKLDLVDPVQRRPGRRGKDNIRNSPAGIQNAAALGSVLRPECSPVRGAYRTSSAAPLTGFTCSGTTNLPQHYSALTT